ncbi:unnamed protein product [Mytilus coruscus]|uniref:Reverse transcriptase domain-containing protein n=1 Tax=Mytilus coruscus TaxID=42192 RepID=A0A6J8F3E1_MYTCO|nr:unnamed protein product [Mytilus coruscus]
MTQTKLLNIWYSLFNNVLNKHPIKTNRVKNVQRPEWLTPEILTARQNRNYYHKKYDLDRYRFWRNKSTSLIDDAKNNFYKTSIEQAKNPKELWKYVKGLNQTKSSPFPSQLIHNGVITETQHIVDAFNKHFINIAPKDSLSTSQSYKFDSNKIYEEVAAKVPQDTWFYIPLITVAEVKDCLSNLNVAKATGIDQISPRILKLSSEVISPQKLAKTDHVLNLTVGNSHIRDVNGEKLLGVFLDENLEWTAQIDTLCTKISTRLKLLSRIKKSLPLETRKLYFNGFILPILDYCCTIWGNTSDQNTNRLDKLQKRAARIILELPYDTPSNTMFQKLSWLRFTDRIIYHKALYVHRCLYGSVPEYLSNKISYVTNKNGMQLGSNTTQLLNIPKTRTNTFRRSFSYSGPTLWNKLPEALRHMSNINTFKTNCFKFLLENPGII